MNKLMKEYDEVRKAFTVKQKDKYDYICTQWRLISDSRYEWESKTLTSFANMHGVSVPDWLEWLTTLGDMYDATLEDALFVDFLKSREDILEDLKDDVGQINRADIDLHRKEDGLLSIHRTKRGWTTLNFTLKMHDWYMRRSKETTKANCIFWTGDKKWGEDFFKHLEEVEYFIEED